MLTLKQDNERLQRQVEHHSAVSSPHHTVDRRSSYRRSPADEASVVTGMGNEISFFFRPSLQYINNKFIAIFSRLHAGIG